MWEEPCISGDHGSGTVFFSGCSLRCIYCQNYEIAHAETGKRITVERLSEIFLELSEKGAHNINLVTPTHYTPEIIQAVSIAHAETGKRITVERLSEIFLELSEKGAHNINLVTPTHYTPEIIQAVSRARTYGLTLPIVYNCSGYEKVETLKRLEGIVDIYLTDFKYMDSDLAARFSKAPDYPTIAKEALEEMVRQTGAPVFDGEELMKKGVIVRHLLLPHQLKNAKAVVRYVYETYGNLVYLSLMNQYTSLPQVSHIPELNRKVTEREYEKLLDYAIDLGVEQAFIQEGETAEESFIPSFECEGI